MRDCGPVRFALGKSLLVSEPQFLSQTTEGPNQVVSEVPFCSVVPNANPRHVSIYFSFSLLNLAFIFVSESGIGAHYLLPLPWAGGQMAVAASGGSSQVGHSASSGLQEPREGLQRPPGIGRGGDQPSIIQKKWDKGRSRKEHTQILQPQG